MSKETIPEVFIIESLGSDEMNLREGKILCGILRMMGKRPKYRHIETAVQFRTVAQEFRRSRYRYLHISCHGNKRNFELAGDSVPFADFATMFRRSLQRRRLFLSACSIAQLTLATRLFEDYDMAPYSITGPLKTIGFSTAAVIWASLYNLLFRENAETAKGEHIRQYLRTLCKLNNEVFKYFGRRKEKPHFKQSRLPALLMMRRQ